MGKVAEKFDVQELVKSLRKEMPRLRNEYAVRNIGIFGSYVRGEQKKESDLDVLVEFSTVPGMFRFMELERELSRILGIPVDLVQKEALKQAIGKRIIDEVRQI